MDRILIKLYVMYILENSSRWELLGQYRNQGFPTLIIEITTCYT